MPRGDIIRARLAARFAASNATITVVYPPARAAIAGTAPVPLRPVSPLTGLTAAPSAQYPPAAPTPSRPTAGPFKVIWTDNVRLTLNAKQPSVGPDGWAQGAEALCRVLASDAYLDPSDTTAGTIFDGADAVIRNGRRYRVMKSETSNSNFADPFSFYIWLEGAIGQ